jgi:hypothetical protein
MTHSRTRRASAFWRRPALGLTVAALTATGAGPAAALVSGSFFIPHGAERIAWLYPGLSQNRQPQIAELGPWARTDYARFTGPAGVGELLFKTANYGNYVIDHPPGLRRLARSWNHLRGRIRVWHASRVIRSYFADTVYRRVELDDGRSCVVFSGEGQVIAYDPEARNGLVYFGYFCARAGRRLDDVEARRVITSLRLTYDRRQPTPDRPASAKARAIATGSLASRTGNARFPFRLATPYNERDGFRLRP